MFILTHIIFRSLDAVAFVLMLRLLVWLAALSVGLIGVCLWQPCCQQPKWAAMYLCCGAAVIGIVREFRDSTGVYDVHAAVSQNSRNTDSCVP